MKIFFSQNDLLGSVPRSYLSEWVKPLFPKPRYSIYGLNPEDLETSKEQSDADAFSLPFTWNYYFEKEKIDEALNIIQEYGQWNKPIFTWVGGDYTLRVPKGNFILFQQNGYQSQQRKNEYAYPVIIRDPLDYLNLSEIKIVTKEEKLNIGFCGLANSNWIDGSFRVGKNYMFKLVNSINKPYLDLSRPISGASLRRRTLDLLSNSNDLKTNFLIRSSSGGQKINSKTYKLEFWQNILTSPYILCIRGAGNYSARFYETLAMGRIPVFVNTDCALPLDDEIDWKQHCIWVEDYELDNIIRILNNFHEKLSNDDFKQLQIENRQLWIDKLTYHGFYNSFRDKYVA